MEYTPEEIEAAKQKIATMEHTEMCRLWRFAKTREELIYMRSDLGTGKLFIERLFEYFGGFTPTISKQLGWK